MYDWHPHTIQKLFERVAIEDLPDNSHDRSCGVCNRAYGKAPDYNTSEPWTRLPRPAEEEPIRLVCGHVLGENCIQQWTFPQPWGRNQNSCPLCREPVFVLDDVQEELYEEELENYAAEGCLVEDYTIVDFLCSWIEGEEMFADETEGDGDDETGDDAAEEDVEEVVNEVIEGAVNEVEF